MATIENNATQPAGAGAWLSLAKTDLETQWNNILLSLYFCPGARGYRYRTKFVQNSNSSRVRQMKSDAKSVKLEVNLYI